MRKAVLTFFLTVVCSTCIALVSPTAAAQTCCGEIPTVYQVNTILSGTIDTYAGGGTYVNSPPLSVAMRPAALAIGPGGGIYVDEPSEVNGDEAPNTIEDSEIFRIDPATGAVTRVVGNGVDGASGVGGPPTDVSLYDPLGLAFDSQGNLYVADTGNNRILKISADPAYDPSDPSALAGGPITSRSVVSVFSTSFSHPVSLAFDSTFSNLYVATTSGGTAANAFSGVTRMSLSDGTTTKVAGCEGANTPGCGEQLNDVVATTVAIDPADDGNDLAFDSTGNLYIASGYYGENNDHVFRVNTSDGILTSVAGDESSGGRSCTQPSTAGGVNFSAQSIAFDGSGNLLLDDLYQDLLCKISPDPATGVIDSNSPIVPVAGGADLSQFALYGQPAYGDGGPANQAVLLYPDGIVVDQSGNVFISDASENRVRKIAIDSSTGVVDGDSIITTAAGAGGRAGGGAGGDGNVATAATMNEPLSVALDAAGDLFIGSDDVIRRVDAKTHVISTFAGHLGAAPPTCPSPPEDGEPAACASFGGGPAGLAVDSSGNVYVTTSSSVQRIDTSGTVTTVVSGLSSPHGLAFDPQGNLYIADTGDNEILQLTPDGTITTIAGTGEANSTPCQVNSYGFCPGDGGPATGASLNKPMYLVWGPAPNLAVQQGSAPIGSGNLYFTDSGDDAVRIVDLYNGSISTLLTPLSATASYPVLFGDCGSVCGLLTGIAIDGAGNLFVSTDNTDGGNAIWEATAPEMTSPEPDDPWASTPWRLTNLNTIAPLNLDPYGIFVGDGGPPIEANVSSPQAVAIDPNGNLFVADEYFHRIRIITGVAAPACAADATGSTSISRSGFSYNFFSKVFAQTITLTNTSGSALDGPIYVALSALSPNATLANAGGQTVCAAPVGSPYVVSTGSLNPGASVTLPLQFTDPTRTAITYSTGVFAGAGKP